MNQSLVIFPQHDKYRLGETLKLADEEFECLRCLDHLENQKHSVFLLKHDGEKYYSFLFCEECGNRTRFTENNLVRRIEIPTDADITATLETHGIFKIKNQTGNLIRDTSLVENQTNQGGSIL